MSEADQKAAAKAEPALAPVVDDFVAFLKQGAKAQGRSIVMMNNPMGEGTAAPDQVCDAFLASLGAPSKPIAPPAPEFMPRPSKSQVGRALNELIGYVGERPFSKTRAAEIVRHAAKADRDQAALIGQIATFLLAEAAEAGSRSASLELAGNSPAERTRVMNRVIAHLDRLPLVPVPPEPTEGEKRRIPGTTRYETYQFGMWLPFRYDPFYKVERGRVYVCADSRGWNEHPGLGELDHLRDTDLYRQLAWESENPTAARKLRSATQPVREAATVEHVALEREQAAREKAQWEKLETFNRQNGTTYRYWGEWEHDLDLRNDAILNERWGGNRARIHRIITGDGGGGGGLSNGVASSGGDLGRKVHVVDLPDMDARDVRPTDGRDLVADWVARVDARWNAATNGNFGNGRFGGPVR